ncbi:WD40-repeat-containing domain protein [Amanita rubescens]|nr:WD40-repeat-containing domain protein [Amanita rubescens]
MFYCAISGDLPQEPVVSAKSGKVYERRLIVKYIAENGTDPVTGEKLEESDLIAIKASPDTAPPRPPSHSSIPALLQTLSNEWDALMLEMFALKQQNNSLRQELSYALYAQDAATRVVARLIRERDASREALANVSATIGVAPPRPADDIEMAEEAAAEETLPAEIVAKIDETHQSLSSARKKRKPPAGYTTATEVKTFTSKHTIPSLHSASPAGITSLVVSRLNPSQFLTGGNDKVVQLYDRSTDKVLASLKGHTKKINQVAFREREGDPTLIISAGADKIAKIWSYDSASSEYIPKSTIRTHKGEVSGLVVHPTSIILAVSSTDKTYSMHDLNTFNQIFRSAPAEDPFASLAIHPDGTLLALGTPASTIQIYDIRTENGYHLLGPNSLSSVAIWDLRKQKTAHTIPLGDDYKINKVTYDASAQFLAIAGSLGGRIFAHKTWEELLQVDEGGEMSDIEIWGSTGREVRIWGMPG